MKLTTIILLISLSANAQAFFNGSFGAANKYFSHELQAGYRHNSAFASIGYTSVLESSQPVFFNIRAGAVIKEKFIVYAGYVRVVNSSDDKSQNYNAWQAGCQYHFFYYDRGNFYATASITGSRTVMVYAGAGMAFNLK